MDPAALAGLIDVDTLTRYLHDRVPGPDRPLEIEKHEAGYSNETFYVTRGEQRWVLRRPPRGELLPTSHDVLREFRVMSALNRAGARARVPRTVIGCEDPAIIGAPFYLMERVEGLVIREELPEVFDPLEQRVRLGEELVDALIELHEVDWQAAGLENLGHPQGFVERQVRRWSGQLELTLPHTRPLPGIDEVTQWLHDHVPESGPPTIVHGDYKLDNVILAAETPVRVLALLDWEMATVGDPLTDLGWWLSYWGPTGSPAAEIPDGNNIITSQPGFASRAELIARYEQRSRRAVHDFQFYLCLGVWKMAIICEGLYRHYLDGTAPNQRTGEMDWRVPQAIARMHQILAGEV